VKDITTTEITLLHKNEDDYYSEMLLPSFRNKRGASPTLSDQDKV
jgi:hypothetical protein